MVRVDQEEDEEFLAQFAKYGGYVPRFFFLNPDGQLNTKINSGHPRYPYFFHSANLAGLKTAMRKAAGG